jgi:uncharacterized protein (DUF302 family)
LRWRLYIDRTMSDRPALERQEETMETQQKRSASYGYTTSLGKLAFSEAERRVTEALKGEGFGVLTEIDVQATLKKKLGVDFRPYKILGACNPPLAHRALSAELLIGLLMPCNVVLFAEDDGAVTVSIAKPEEMFRPVGNPEMLPLVKEVDDRIQRVMQRL